MAKMRTAIRVVHAPCGLYDQGWAYANAVIHRNGIYQIVTGRYSVEDNVFLIHDRGWKGSYNPVICTAQTLNEAFELQSHTTICNSRYHGFYRCDNVPMQMR